MLKFRKERSFKNQSCLLLSTDVLGFAELEEKFVGIGGVRLVGDLAGRQFALPHVLAHQFDLARVQMDLLHQLVVDLQEIRPLHGLRVDAVRNLDRVCASLVDGGVPEGELGVVAFLGLLEAQLLPHLQLGVCLAVDLELQLILDFVEVLAIVGHPLLDDFDERVIVPEAERVLRLAEVLGDEDLLALLDLNEEEVLVDLDAAQEDPDEQHLLDALEPHDDLDLAQIQIVLRFVQLDLEVLLLRFRFVHADLVTRWILKDGISK